MSMCEDNSEILLLKFENRCPCKGCPAEIRRAIVTFDGVRETRSVDYDKGTAEIIVEAEVARNPQKLCDWILKKARKHAYVDKTCNTSYVIIIISLFFLSLKQKSSNIPQTLKTIK